MSDNSEANIAAADTLTLLLHNQHAIGAAVDEIIMRLSENGVGSAAANAIAAMETLDTNAQGLHRRHHAATPVVGIVTSP